MRKAMTYDSFTELMEYIDEYHMFGKGGKHIKYVVPIIDTRTADIHSLSFYGLVDKTFTITNENSNLDLEAWVLSWFLDKESEYLAGEYTPWDQSEDIK